MLFRTAAGLKGAALSLFGLFLAAGAPALARADSFVAKDAKGFGDEQFDRLVGGATPASLQVPALSALYDAQKALKRIEAPARLTDAEPSLTPALFRGGVPTSKPLARLQLTSAFGLRVHPVLGGYRNHKGVDLAAPMGSPIYATADGRVRRADWDGGYGLAVELVHSGGYSTRYGHMSRLNVRAGALVRKGDTIGFVGSTGRSTGPHLHYEVLVDGRAVNPMAYVNR